jgi:hypothetical protein
VLKIAKELYAEKCLAASPKMQMLFNGASYAVQSYYEVWQCLPYVQEGMIGVGVFALSERGRSRFDKFPDVIADDGFVRALFTESERVSVENCYSIVRAPLNIDGLIKIKTRSRLGRYELSQKFPHLLQNEKKNYGAATLCLFSKIKLWTKLPIYIYVNFITRFLAKSRKNTVGYAGWQRDESSRKQSFK